MNSSYSRVPAAVIAIAASFGGVFSTRLPRSGQDGAPSVQPQSRGVGPASVRVGGEVRARAEEVRSRTPDFAITKHAKILLKLVPPGEFVMGSPESDAEGFWTERPQHPVRITRPFYLGVREVTQQQYEDVVGVNPSWFTQGRGRMDVGKSTDAHPVETVSWFDAVRFCNMLSGLEGEEPFYHVDGKVVGVPDWNGSGYRLPTEAEWEYAYQREARSLVSVPKAKVAASLREYAWFDESFLKGTTHTTGHKRPNQFGFYDMSGNVSEWCWDRFDPRYYVRSPVEDPRGPWDVEDHSFRVIRGGNWLTFARACRPQSRRGEHPGFADLLNGFRVARGTRP